MHGKNSTRVVFMSVCGHVARRGKWSQWLRFPSLQRSYGLWLLFVYFCFTKSMWYLLNEGGGKHCLQQETALEQKAEDCPCD